ncbi:hypothetical protein RJ639_007218 [Escallonia herrerae]|uniref:Uncharacterized protein n=1 Tax=Escallonia herrerae TaxID=1293975 RepID=A0AA89AVC3_9ASTE|nr:hypothetical protein RJ639_007218 [Escallonia herrerae]
MAEETPVEAKEDVPEIVPFDPSKKKKKKKVVLQDLGDDAANQLSEKTENISISEGVESTFVGLKKKKPVETDPLSDRGVHTDEDIDGRISEDEGEGHVLQPQYPWEGSNRDYVYEEMNMSYAMAAEVRTQYFQKRIAFSFSDVSRSTIQCGSGRSVAPIKTGFVARVGRRKAGT